MIRAATAASGGPDASTMSSIGSFSVEDGRDVDMTPSMPSTGRRGNSVAAAFLCHSVFCLKTAVSMPTPVVSDDSSKQNPVSVSERSPALPPVVSNSSVSPAHLSDAHLSVPGLSLSEFQNIYDSCVPTDSYGPVIRMLGARLRSWEQVNNSFVQVGFVGE